MNALFVAAERFKENVATLGESAPRLAEQFERQIEEAQALALKIGEAQ